MSGKLVRGKNEALDAEDKYKTDVERTAEYVERFDILETITNTGNDEVFTPRKIVDQMLDLLPEKVWHDPNLKWLNPATKTGIFEREIAIRLDEGLKDVIPDLETRRKHILQKMIFSIGQTKFTSHVARRTLYYCSSANRACDGIKENGHYVNGFAIGNGTWFDDAEGNIKTPSIDHDFNPKTGKCRFCGVGKDSHYNDESQREKYSYEFVHCKPGLELQKHLSKRFFKGDESMKFDVIVGNPPYQLDDEGNGASSRPIYQKFVQQAISLKPSYLCMIIPARWYAGGKGLDQFRAEMIASKNISVIYDYANSADCFQNVELAGGVCYFLWDAAYNGDCEVHNVTGSVISSAEVRKLNEFETFVRSNVAVRLLRKVSTPDTMETMVSPRNVFGIPSNGRGHPEKKDGDMILLHSKGQSFISPTEFKDINHFAEKYKVVMTRAMSGGNKPASDGKYQIVSSLKIIDPGTVFTETYLCIGAFDSVSEAESLVSYLRTKFVRYLMLQTLTSIDIIRGTFCFVPKQSWDRIFTDNGLYQEYGLNQEEIDAIESSIRELE